MSDIHSPRHYFLEVLLPAYDDLGKTLMTEIVGGKRDLIAVGRAAEACLHLADHIACDPTYNQNIPGAPKSKKYIKALSEKYPDFAIAKDIANSFKHRNITEQERLNGIASLKERWALIRYSDEQGHYWATRKAVLVRLNGGVEIFAEDVVERCIAAWVQELLKLGVISSEPRIKLAPARFIRRAEVPFQPRIEMRTTQGEYFESQPILLSYDPERDMFQPLQGTIGSVDVEVKVVEEPSRFSPSGIKKEHQFTLSVRDSSTSASGK